MEKDKIRVERTTKTGEFIPSFDNWLEPETQRKRADKLANVTKKNKEK